MVAYLARPKDPTNSMFPKLGERWNACLLWPLLGLAVVASAAAEPRVDDPEELRRTIDAAIVAVPLEFMDGGEESTINSGAGRWYTVQAEVSRIRSDAKIPTVIYMHSCSGYGSAGMGHIHALVDHGYAVIAPNSFARTFKPLNCDPESRTFGTFPGAMAMRLAEAWAAHAFALSLPWVDQHNIFMMGFSEGGATTARYAHGGLAGRVIIGWNCLPSAQESLWSPYIGIKGPLNEPVIAVLGGNDPWFKRPELSGDCSTALASRPRGLSIIAPDLGHNAIGDAEILERVLAFMARNRRTH